jgi:hypothetical protein
MEDAEEQRILELQTERNEAEEWGIGWEEPPQPLSWLSFTRSDRR